MMPTLRTTIEINTGGLSDYSVPVEVEYTYRAGCSATYTQPGEDDSVELTKITVIEANGDTYGADWLVTLLECDEELLTLCAVDENDRREDAAERRAESIREDRELRGMGL